MNFNQPVAAPKYAGNTAGFLDRISKHPEVAKLLSDFRRRAFAILDRNVTELVGQLGQATRPSAKAKLLSSVTPHLLTTTSRQSARTIEVRRKFAHDIVVASLYNRYNPAWDMTNADSYQTDTDDIILLLMQRPDPIQQQKMDDADSKLESRTASIHHHVR